MHSRKDMNWKEMSFIGDRDVNEDSLRAIDDGETKCFIVADGLGGHGQGDVASSMAVNAFDSVFRGSQAPLDELMNEAFAKAQNDILARQSETGRRFEMKTTVCALAIRGSEVIWGHIGDTRLYAFAHNRVKLRTLDHSVPQMLVLSHEIKEKEIRNHPDRNRLLRVLGVSGENPRYELSQVQNLKKFQAFLLCSDGFWELIMEKEMSATLRKCNSAEDWLSQMYEIVMQRGKEADMDNCSAIAIIV